MQLPSLGRIYPIRERNPVSNDLQTQVLQLKAQVTALQASLDALTARVTALENA